MTWLNEKEAAERMGYTDQKWFRWKVRKGMLNISYRHSDNKRVYEYSEKDIKKHFEKNAVMVY
jgi:hypothetical protein